MTLPSTLTADETQLIEGAMVEMRHKLGEPMTVAFLSTTVLRLVALFQLALRHPDIDNSPLNVDAGEAFVQAAREYFADCPYVLEMIRRGAAHDYDRPSGGT